MCAVSVHMVSIELQVENFPKPQTLGQCCSGDLGTDMVSSGFQYLDDSYPENLQPEIP